MWSSSDERSELYCKDWISWELYLVGYLIKFTRYPMKILKKRLGNKILS